jgi:hypothetical protein
MNSWNNMIVVCIMWLLNPKEWIPSWFENNSMEHAYIDICSDMPSHILMSYGILEHRCNHKWSNCLIKIHVACPILIFSLRNMECNADVHTHMNHHMYRVSQHLVKMGVMEFQDWWNIDNFRQKKHRIRSLWGHACPICNLTFKKTSSIHYYEMF